MPKKTKKDNEEPAIKQIGANTQIIFTIKSFFALVGTLLGLFFGFYEIVVVPKMNATEKHYETMFGEQRDQNKLFYEKLGNINSSIGSLNATIEALNKRGVEKHNVENAGGSLGSN